MEGKPHYNFMMPVHVYRRSLQVSQRVAQKADLLLLMRCCDDLWTGEGPGPVRL